MEALAKRYPDLAFLLSIFPKKSVSLSEDPAPLERWLDTIDLDAVEVLYLIGLFNHPLPERILKWLGDQKQHALVFVESELGAFASFHQEALIENPQVHLFQSDVDLAHAFPTDRLAIYLPEGKQFPVEQLYRNSASLSALYSDVLYSHYIVRNVLANYRRLPSSFAANQWAGAFKNVPAILCGGGPSLEKELSTLRALEDQALIFAGGSAITALTAKGIQPHFAMALDPNREEWDLLRQSQYFEGAYLFAPRLHKDVFATANGPFGYLKTDTGGLIEHWLETELELADAPIGPDLGPEAFSVTTLAVSYAYALGCNPIVFAGVDLSFQEGKRYSSGVHSASNSASDPRALEKRMLRKNTRGKKVETLLKWVMEADAIAAFASVHPETSFVNASPNGLGFSGVRNKALSNIQFKAPQCDLKGRIHQLIQETPLDLSEEDVEHKVDVLRTSLSNCRESIRAILADSEAGQVVALFDLKEEPAYVALLSGIDAALDQILPRYHPSLEKEKQAKAIEKAKYTEMLRQVNLFLKMK